MTPLTDSAHYARSRRSDETRRLRLVHADAYAVARDPGLGNFEKGATDAVAVADADLVIGDPVNG